MVRLGDERAFGALYDRHTPYLYRLALRLLGGDEAAAADAVHDAWILAAPRFTTFEGRSTLRSWLSGFVVNVARRRWCERAEVELPGALTNGEVPPIETVVLARLDLERALVELPPGAREILVLHDLEGWTHEEIADRLGVTPGTSKSQLARARALLRARLAPPDHHGGA